MSKPKSGMQHIVTFNISGMESPPVKVNLKAWFHDKCWMSYAIANDVEPFIAHDGEFVVSEQDIARSFEIGEIPDEEFIND